MKKVIEIRTGEKIIIRHIKKTDIEGVWRNFNEVVDEGIYLPVLTPVKSEYEKEAWYKNQKKSKELCIIAEFPKKKPPLNVIGQCEITNTEWEAGTHVGVLGVIVQQKYRDYGIGWHLIDVAIRESKKLNNKEKIVLSCFTNNERAIALYKRMGFKVVGIREKQYYMNDQYYDEMLMELFIEEYLREN